MRRRASRLVGKLEPRQVLGDMGTKGFKEIGAYHQEMCAYHVHTAATVQRAPAMLSSRARLSSVRQLRAWACTAYMGAVMPTSITSCHMQPHAAILCNAILCHVLSHYKHNNADSQTQQTLCRHHACCDHNKTHAECRSAVHP